MLYYLRKYVYLCIINQSTNKYMQKIRKNQANPKKSQRDYDLIVDGKYNRRAIMQRAYAYIINYPKIYTFKAALRRAWKDAQFKLEEELKYKDYEPAFNPNLKISDLYCTRDMQMGYATR